MRHGSRIPPRPEVWLALLSGALALELLIPAARLPLAPDEAYYWYWSQHPAASYFDHPPMVAWSIALTTGLGGHAELWVRAGAWGFFVGTLTLLFATVRRLFPALPREAAWQAVLLANLSLLFPGIGLLMTIDSPLIFFWALAVYAGAGIVGEGRGRDGWLFGAALGGAMLSKYTAVLLVPGMLGLLIVVPRLRAWLGRPEPWIGAAIALAVFSPVLYWNWRHDWASFAFQFAHGFHEKSDPAYQRLLEYLGLQLGIVSPGLWLLLAFYGGAGLWLAVRRRDARLGYLFALSWPVIAFFGWTSVVGERAEGNWPAPGYVAAIPLAVAAWHLGGYGDRRRHRLFAGALLAPTAAIAVLVRIHMLHPVLPIPPRDDPLREFASWPQIARSVAATAGVDIASEAREGWFLVADRGTVLAEAAFYTGIHGLDPTRPERYTFLGDWRARWAGRDAVLLLNRARDPADYGCLFRDMEDTGSRFVPRYRGQPVEEYRVRLYVGRGLIPDRSFPCPAEGVRRER